MTLECIDNTAKKLDNLNWNYPGITVYNIISKLLFNTKYEFRLLRSRMNILQITVIFVVSMGAKDDQFYGGGG